jgi:hypothetical protein
MDTTAAPHKGPTSTKLLPAPPGHPEESLITDARAHLSPAEAIERRLMSLMSKASISLSHLTVARKTGKGR